MRRRTTAKPRAAGLTTGTARRANGGTLRARRKTRASVAEQSNETFSQQQRLRVVGELSMGIAHDVGNALGALSLRLQVLNSISLGEAEGANLQRAIDLVKQMDALLRQMSSLVRIDHPHELAPVDLRRLLRQVVGNAGSAMRLTARAAGQPEVAIECAMRQLPPVLAIEHELIHVLFNLLIVCRDAMPRGGTIRLRCHHHDRWVTLVVADQGPAMRANTAERIFDPNFNSPGREGAGTALASCRRAIERMDGTLIARNRLAGGAEFVVALRRAPANGARKPGQARKSGKSGQADQIP